MQRKVYERDQFFEYGGLCLGFRSWLRCFAEEVELKFVVKTEQTQEALRTFTQGKDGEKRNIYFLETAGMALSQKGIILRLRENPGKADVSTVKLRGDRAKNLPNAEFPPTTTEEEESKAEKDKVIGGKEASSFSITVKQAEGEIANLRNGQRKLKKLFSGKQESFLSEFAQDLDWEKVCLLGPVETEKWKVVADGFRPELTAELGIYPAATRRRS